MSTKYAVTIRPGRIVVPELRLVGDRVGMLWLRTLSLVLAACALGCGNGHNRLSSGAVSGAYEFVITSNVTGGVTLVETNLSASGNQMTASGPANIQVLTLEKKIWYVNGVCTGSTPGENSISASLNGNNVDVMFNEGGYQLPALGVIIGTQMTGNYSISGSSCPDLTGSPSTIPPIPPGVDQGGFIGNEVPNLTGTFSGTLNLPDGTDNASVTLAESSDTSLTATVALTGAVDNGTFNFTGSAVGNVMFVTGTVNQQTLNLFGYFDRSGIYTGFPNSLLIFNYSRLSNAGLLLGQ
jgi:hypothetical protein